MTTFSFSAAAASRPVAVPFSTAKATASHAMSAAAFATSSTAPSVAMGERVEQYSHNEAPIINGVSDRFSDFSDSDPLLRPNSYKNIRLLYSIHF